MVVMTQQEMTPTLPRGRQEETEMDGDYAFLRGVMWGRL
jgi:hypothetical protein